MTEFDFDGLFILDLANNHQGDLTHGLNIINQVGEVVRGHGVKAALKFQFRQLGTFIHPDFKTRKDVKHIPRFMETSLSHEDYRVLIEAVRQQGMISMCTPFDDESVPVILDMGIEVIKVASCSAMDWPLLQRISDTNKPVVVSTAGLNLNKIDRLVSFLEHKRVHFALMHCVALYPTPNHRLNLNQIELFKNRYPQHPIGFSTHEDPDNYHAIRVAYAKGARLFERHVGLEAGEHKLNAYSSPPEKIDQWIQAWKETVEACGGIERSPASQAETESLQSLMRGVFARQPIAKGSKIAREDVFFAMPWQRGSLSSGEWEPGLVADKDYAPLKPINDSLAKLEVTEEERIYRIMLQVKGMLNKARIFIGRNSSVEISHHYGLDRFREFGCVIIDCINRAYCKKLLVMLPRQKHPYHFHQKKEETFQLLHGDLEVELEGKRHRLQPGDIVMVLPGQWHKFHTLQGAIFEEVSTTHFNDDSFYEDERIARLPRKKRKSEIPNWEAMVAAGLY
jgi:sialic acid synthase SpsE/mannose-6-phosphate isomerase-like protein (cupin superfamily)